MYATTSALMRRRRPVLRIVRLFRIDGRQAVADARQGLDQPGFERRVDAAPQFADVRTQHVAVRPVVAPPRVFEPVARYRDPSGPHPNIQQLTAGVKQQTPPAPTATSQLVPAKAPQGP